MQPWIPVAIAALVLGGCGYVGDPLPPALNIPAPVEDLRAFQSGDEVVVRFTVPALTTEGIGIRELAGAELRVAEWDGPFRDEGFLGRSRAIPILVEEPGPVEVSVPVAEFPEAALLMLVRLANEAGRLSDWSNEARLRVVPPLPPPQQLQAELVPEGIRLSWQGHPGREGVRYRVFRAGSDPAAGFAETTVIDVPEWIDTTAVPGETYRYEVDAIIDTEGAQAVSARTPTAAIRMEDRFPPSPPSGLRAVPGLDSVELTWEAGTEPDLAGYHVYRAEPRAALQRIAETVQGLNYSDSAVESGTVYLYTVTAIDLAGNESAQPDPVEIAAP